MLRPNMVKQRRLISLVAKVSAVLNKWMLGGLAIKLQPLKPPLKRQIFSGATFAEPKAMSI
jgi:hypothetical protein